MQKARLLTGVSYRGTVFRLSANCLFWNALGRMMRKPDIGEFNLGASAGAVVGAIGSLFAIGIGPAIVHRKAAFLFGTPLLALICWVLGGIAGWLIGGQVGPRLGFRLQSERAELVGGALGGLLPVIVILIWGWRMAMR
jgi:hypothetical protein